MKLKWMIGKWIPDGEGGGGMASPCSSPQVPPQANVDVSQLPSMLMARLRMGIPRINTFSGDATPGKTKVPFEQWYQKVQCNKDHYPEEVVLERIIWLLKGAKADMARYMGPTTSIAHILCKVSFIFGMVALFDIPMQNFYKTNQGSNEKVPSLP